jgi:hypothetical protein
MRDLREELAALDVRILSYDQRIREVYRHSDICQHLGKIEVERLSITTSCLARQGAILEIPLYAGAYTAFAGLYAGALRLDIDRARL